MRFRHISVYMCEWVCAHTHFEIYTLTHTHTHPQLHRCAMCIHIFVQQYGTSSICMSQLPECMYTDAIVYSRCVCMLRSYLNPLCFEYEMQCCVHSIWCAITKTGEERMQPTKFYLISLDSLNWFLWLTFQALHGTIASPLPLSPHPPVHPTSTLIQSLLHLHSI